MCFSDLFRKLGIFRSGKVEGRYTSGRERPIELQQQDVFDAKKDLMTAKDFQRSKFKPKKGKSKKK